MVGIVRSLRTFHAGAVVFISFLFLIIAVMNIKLHPNHQVYLQTLARMTPEQRLQKAFQLSAMAKELFLTGLRKRFPGKSAEEIKKIYLERVAKCYNRNY